MSNWNLVLAFYQSVETAEYTLQRLKREGFKSSLILQRERALSYSWRINQEIVGEYRKRLLSGEILVLAQVPTIRTKASLDIVHSVESGHPATFLIRGKLTSGVEEEVSFKESLTLEMLQGEAKIYARRLPPPTKEYGKPLLKRLRESERVLADVRREIIESSEIKESASLSSEWFLDNTHVIEGSIDEIQKNLNPKYYKELPKIDGYPRIYLIARDLINCTSGKISKDNLIAYLISFQKIQPLTIGELWAFPLMVKLRLIECLESLALKIEKRVAEDERAAFWGHRLLNMNKREPERLNEFLSDLNRSEPNPSSHFAEELLDHLYDEETLIPIVKNWLSSKFHLPLDDVLKLHQLQASTEQVSFSNSIMSLIVLSQIAWKDIFEKVSLVDEILNQDPANIYRNMNFESRDCYRRHLEATSKGSDKSEIEIAKIVLSLALQGHDELTRHVGFYLLDKGKIPLDKLTRFKATYMNRFRRFILNHSASVYLGFIFLSTAIFLFYLSPKPVWQLILAALAISEIALQLANLLMSLILKPSFLPRMEYREIPEELGTLVVIPMLMVNEKMTEDCLNRLEIHYLANPDPSLKFALFADFADSPTEVNEEDSKRLEEAEKGINDLNHKYGPGKFFLFNRKRIRSYSEKKWIAHERKRGKLEVLNRYLCGEKHDILKIGQESELKNIRYVITLDADTMLPKGKARELIETAAHVLNRPHIEDGRVVRGYTLIQPRVSTDLLQSHHNLFTLIFSDPEGVDPYSQAISEVYQDLSGEGTYHGKGIYDLHAFHEILSERFKDERLLSHDLLEGSYARVGFASAVLLFDYFPDTLLTWARRQHRWIRGDWQILEWILPYTGDKKTSRNPLSLINRWKVFDNLRRSMLAPALFILMLTGQPLWIVLSLTALFMPPLTLLINSLYHFRFNLQDFAFSVFRTLIHLIILPYEAYLSVDAIARALWRRWISGRYLLEWSTASSLSDNVRRTFIMSLSWVSLLGAALLFYGNPIGLFWLIAPLAVHFLDKPIKEAADKKLNDEDKKFLKEVAFKTWGYFTTFVTPETHWLPPDNYQAALGIEVAPRTSPTNIGLWMVSVVSAYDFKFIALDQAVEYLYNTSETLKKMEKYEGHLLNWYNILTLAPLHPRYVSTVDSGNFIVCLWTIDEALEEMIFSPLLSSGDHSRYFSWVKEGEDVSKYSLFDLAQEKSPADRHSRENARETLTRIRNLREDLRRLAVETDLKFLYNEDRKVFSIGLHVDERRLDNSYYDLLASEARLASFVAIARDEVPVEHWWSLGRPYTYIKGKQVLRSWGGTMFEYLMPLIFTKSYSGSLLEEGCAAAVFVQREYAKARGIPWGISESAFSEIDRNKTYQYRSFGVPRLGFKRGLEDDLVVSPYSSALSLHVDPVNAVANLVRMKDRKESLLSDYGFYESIDFSRQIAPHGERGVIVYAYMAHHQGMSLSAINNVLNNNILCERFHRNLQVAGVESLLYEKVPLNPIKTKGTRKDIPISRLTPFSSVPIMGIIDTPHSYAPKVNLLSNGAYSIMLTNAGGGYSRWKDFDITRWRSDITLDYFGKYVYLKDVHSGQVWSAAFNPTHTKGGHYNVAFKSDKVEFRRRDYQIETHTDIVVSPEDNAEIWNIVLINVSKEEREIELTSYSELALAPHRTDRAHPAFNKLFIATESVPHANGLIGYRRLRAPDDTPIWAGHLVTSTTQFSDPLQFETDRAVFIGRDRNLVSPAAMGQDLSNSQGTVLDPIFSLRRKVAIKPGERVQMIFVTAVADTRDSLIKLMEKYNEIHSCQRAVDMAWTNSQLELRHLRIHQEEAQLFQKLASRILYPHMQLRPSADRIKRNRFGQSRLWAYGISGDLPIVLITVTDQSETDFVRIMLAAHTFWRMRGLKVDLVILCDETTGYQSPLLDSIQKIAWAHSQPGQIDSPGGIFIRCVDQIPEQDLTVLLAAAHVNLIAARGTLRQQLVSPFPHIKYPDRLNPIRYKEDFSSEPLSFMELTHFNGVGGFTGDGREYVIYLTESLMTPMPWINVMANENFGTIVSESGLGATWYGNSQSNRLTPWSNDPVINPITDSLYIRDEELGICWTATPGPIREESPYRIRHGQGYTIFEHNSHGIEQRLTLFVPDNDSIRVQKLSLTNKCPHKRRISITSYLEWVLGATKEDAEMHVSTDWDPESQALFAYNGYNPDYPNSIAFSASWPPANTYTGDRTEFLGRNSSLKAPMAMKRVCLANVVGCSLDPCAALQVKIDLEPGETKDLFFLLGYAGDPTEARQLIFKYRDKKEADQAFKETVENWDAILSTLQFETPDPTVDKLLNRWLVYQNLSCRFWGRSAFYQSSGAFGFRDQLQDAMALVYTRPELSRAQILRAASRQFLEGDVQHWWHPPRNGGVRTRITDDLLWLPFVVAHYTRVTQDFDILKEEVPFIKGPLLEENQHESYFIPEVTEEKATILEHCRRSLQKGITAGPQGLPLIGGGDWNDGMNRVGIDGRGESVWLAWFLVHVMNDFADLLDSQGNSDSSEGFRIQAKRLAETIEAKSWDGAWYHRAYYDDGTPLGSKNSIEARMDSISQSWAVISGHADPARTDTALKSVEDYLINDDMLLLLKPPFDKTPNDPGYIKGYPPGVRENGGQYTHGSLWVPLALARKGQGDLAVRVLQMMNPVSHTATSGLVQKYKTEPYAVAADIYALPGHIGRGGWTWYTGSAAWMYRVWLEEIYGFRLRGSKLTLKPVLPSDWKELKLTYKYKSSTYEILILNTKKGEELLLDGVVVHEIDLKDDGLVHKVKLTT